jgi:hypothetical protein
MPCTTRTWAVFIPEAETRELNGSAVMNKSKNQTQTLSGNPHILAPIDKQTESKHSKKR